MHKSKRNLAPASAPDVRYEMDENGTRLLIRKFDFPRPPKSSMSPTLLFSNSKEKWKYQHDVPEGKIITKRVHELNQITPTISKSNQNIDTSTSECSSVSKVIPTAVQNQMTLKPSESKDIKVIAPKDQNVKLLSPVLNLQAIDQTVSKSFLCGEKIKLNNLPHNVISNSMQVIDTKIVNGKKVVYLKALKEVGKPIEKSANNNLSSQTPLQNKVEPRKDEKIVKTVFQSGNASCLNEKNDEVQSFTPPKKILQNVPDMQLSNNSCAPITTVHSVLTQKLTQIGKPMANVTAGPSDSTVKKIDVQVNKTLSVVAPIIVPHSSVQVSPIHILPQSTYELKSSNAVLCAPTMTTYSTIPLNEMTGCREIMLPLKTNLKLDSCVLNKDSFVNDNLISKNNKKQAKSDTSSVNNSVFPVDFHKKGKKGELKLVPADSTTPFLFDSSSVTSVTSTTDNTVPKDAIILMNQEDTTCSKQASNVNSKESSIQTAETKNASCNESNILIFNKTQNLNLSGSNTTVVAKQNINYNEMIRRRKIALQYQQDIQKSKIIPRLERTIELPARKVKVADISTQTTLFCLLEPGRMVEMYLNEEFVDMRTSNADTCANPEQMKNKKHTNKVASNIINHHLKSPANHHSESSENMDPPLSKRICLDENWLNVDTLKKGSGSYQNTENDCSFLQLPMDIQDDNQPQIEGMAKENLLQRNSNNRIPSMNQNSEHDLQSNNIDKMHSNSSVCLQSSMNSMNLNGKNKMGDKNSSDIAKLYANKNIINQLFMDYRISLVPDEDSNLPIHNAVMDSDHKKVERQCLVLLGQRKTVDVKNIRNETPLHLAVLCHDLKMVSLLLKFKARVNIPDSAGNTALHMAIIWGKSIEILKLLLATVDDGSSMLNDANDEGYSPLHLCVLHNKSEEAFILIKKKADVNIRDRKSGRTPLFHAEENGNKDLSRMLINAGASTTISNFGGQTPLHASELSYLMDRMRTNSEILQSSNPLVVPCSCVSNNSVDEEGLSGDEDNTKFDENVKISELIVSDVSSDAFDLYEAVFHDR